MFQFFLLPFQLIQKSLEGIGRYVELMASMFRSIFTWHKNLNLVIDHMYQIGVLSIPIVILTSLFSGMVISVQAAYQFESGFVPNWFVGSVVGESILMELAPMMTALVMTGRIGATIAAEIGTMRVSEQIDALESLSFDPISFLIMPRILASAVMFPILVIIADCFGILGGLIAALNSMDVSFVEFIRGLRNWFRPWDAWFGLIKGLFFGLAITSIACYQGFYTTGGATGVGKSTTATVVVSCIAIVFLDYILAALLL
ncbi:MAG: ABC transporter permease [Candidatus Marinimicrobia bacterium]|jgi:phospholipid/cholesterol/gamma-HCH transport system permease protein|nr:ABC transporter permease [Candidatus Neomarinimicrobiota bacterium]MDP6853085.1 ABC transporter permease [Candidatus Neomarinimicrobiota bacterium]MDP6936724.1 ABC transporter permease [Candidatus Neomarinimicrobiota bacterium]